MSRRQLAERFDSTIRPHVMTMYQSALRMTGSGPEAEDLVQDVLTKLYRRLDELERVEAIRPWLLRVVYHEFVDSLRRRGRMPSTVHNDHAYYTAPDLADCEPETAYQSAELSSHLQHAVAQLPMDQRTLVELHMVQGYTLQELAQTLGKPLGTLKAQVHRAKAKLRKCLSERQPFPPGERL